MQAQYVYLPGLGNGLFNKLRRAMLVGWRLRGIRVSFIDLNWSDQDELSQAKYRRALEFISQYGDRPVILIGESAGGSMALRLLLESDARIEGVLTVCGFNNGAKYIDKRHIEAHPGFIPTVDKVDRLLNESSLTRTSLVTNYYSASDGLVDLERSQIPGALAIKLPPLTHVAAIGYFLLRTAIKGIR